MPSTATLKIDLLPSAYQHRRRRHRRVRLGAIVGSFLVAGELVAGVVLNSRADHTRDLMAATAAAVSTTNSLKKALIQPARQADQLTREVSLAERLRTKHHWSRLLGTLAQATPEKVVIEAVSTMPQQWSSGLLNGPVINAAPAGGPQSSGRRLIEGVTVSGHAADHDDLSAFMAAIHASGSFATIDLKQARREKYLEEDAIMFELQCKW